MRRFEYSVAALLALSAVALDVWAVSSRCAASPEVNISILCFGLFIQAFAVGLPLVRGAWSYGASAKLGLKVIAGALVLFVGSVLAIRYSLLYSDAIGKPNYFRSAGLACRSPG